LQRILPRGEIETLDHTAIPRFRMPEGQDVFASRAARLRQLAQRSFLPEYLLLMAHMADAQQRALLEFSLPMVDDSLIEQAHSNGMPPLPATAVARDPVWREILRSLLTAMLAVQNIATQATLTCKRLLVQLDEDPVTLEQLADDILADRDADGAAAPFVMGALQVYWTRLAIDLGENRLPVVYPFGVCPACGSLPVASMVRVGGQQDGCRYLCCALCATEWHLVRVTCSSCESTKDIAYHYIEGGPEAVKAESCGHCRIYRKIFYQEKDLHVEPVADDLASLALDLLMDEAGFVRASGNPLLWQSPGK